MIFLPSFPSAFANLVTKTDDGAPKGYLNWLVFDRNYTFITGGFKQITTICKEAGSDVAHEYLSSGNITITQPGYVYIYLSNESASQVEVYFDDFKVTQTKSPVIQQEDYYPFGLKFNSYSRESSVPNNMKLFQDQEHIDDLGLNWDSFKWRNHMPDIGRFFNVDPLATKYVYNSPYAFSENCVTSHVELEGLEKLAVNFTTTEPNKREYRSQDQAAQNPAKPENTTFGNSSPVNGKTSMTFTVNLGNGKVSNVDANNMSNSFLVKAFNRIVSGDVFKANHSINTTMQKDGTVTVSGKLEGSSFNMSIKMNDGKLDIVSQMKNIPNEDAAKLSICAGDTSSGTYTVATKQGTDCFFCGDGNSNIQKASTTYSVDKDNNAIISPVTNDKKDNESTIKK